MKTFTSAVICCALGMSGPAFANMMHHHHAKTESKSDSLIDRIWAVEDHYLIGHPMNTVYRNQHGNEFTYEGDIDRVSEEEAGTVAKANYPAEGGAAALIEKGPLDVCAKVVDAANRGDMAAIEKYSEFKLSMERVDQLKQSSCKSEHVSGMHAFVEAKDKDGMVRYLPFIRVGDSWKFDSRTFTSFYRSSKKALEDHTG